MTLGGTWRHLAALTRHLPPPTGPSGFGCASHPKFLIISSNHLKYSTPKIVRVETPDQLIYTNATSFQLLAHATFRRLFGDLRDCPHGDQCASFGPLVNMAEDRESSEVKPIYLQFAETDQATDHAQIPLRNVVLCCTAIPTEKLVRELFSNLTSRHGNCQSSSSLYLCSN